MLDDKATDPDGTGNRDRTKPSDMVKTTSWWIKGRTQRMVSVRMDWMRRRGP